MWKGQFVTASSLGQPVVRTDGYIKASGQQKYPSDIPFSDALWLRVKRAPAPHGRIHNIDIEQAVALPDVVTVLTATDVPGLNAFGLLVQDMPVFCQDVFRFPGDALALIIAKTSKAAEEALDLITIDFTPLPVITDPYDALELDAPKLHASGNLCSEVKFGHGDIETGFAQADVIIERAYQTGRQEHAYLETEAGYAYYETMPDGGKRLVICAGGQNPFNDRQQIARSLGLPEEDIRVLNPIMGGAFGGKEEVSVQIYLALATYITGQPTRLVFDREESIISSIKRHPFHMRYKTGVTNEGKLVAAQVELLSDTGAYASLGPAVVGLAAEHCCGPYYFPHTEIIGKSAYTNNSFCGAFRGFGNPQVATAIEQQIDEMAQVVGIDPIEFRLMNLIQPGQITPAGFPMHASITMDKVLSKAQTSELLDQPKGEPETPYKKRGVGLAAVWQGFGLGAGIESGATIGIQLTDSGGYQVTFSACDLGQGTVSVMQQIAAHELNTQPERVDIYFGDSLHPNSGSSNASRTVFTVGNAVRIGAQSLHQAIIEAASSLGEGPQLVGEYININERIIPLSELAAEFGPIEAVGIYEPPLVDAFVLGIPHIAYSYSVQIAAVEIDTLTGEVEVLVLEHYLDAGKVLNPDGVTGQSEGAIAQGIGFALLEDTIVTEGIFQNPTLSKYLLPSVKDIPKTVKTITLEYPEPVGPYGARGIAEIGLTATTAAIANAIYRAIGRRFNQVPIRPHMILEALNHD